MSPKGWEYVAAWFIAAVLLLMVAISPLTKAGSKDQPNLIDVGTNRFELDWRSVPRGGIIDVERDPHYDDEAARWFREGMDRL